MRLLKPEIERMWITPNPLKTIERIGRVCYKSEGNITEDSYKKFIEKLLKRGHEAVIEHACMSYRIICDRGVSHELVRHRLFSFAQESTRYCDYNGGEMEFIIPSWSELEPGTYSYDATEASWVNPESPNPIQVSLPGREWLWAMYRAETTYREVRKYGWVPQQARSVLPNSLKTEIVISGNFREWRHFFSLRCDKAAHPQMREVANMILQDAASAVEIVFDEYFDLLEPEV